jgi:16S rRNA (cytosine967-C5)-methyltransferase
MKRAEIRRAPAPTSTSSSQSTGERLATAARVVAAVVSGRASLDEVLAEATRALVATDRAAVQAIASGTIRWHLRIEGWLVLLLERPGQVVQPLVRALLEVGLHQLAFSAHPSHAIVNEAVEAARLLRQPRAAGFVNALLRRFGREREAILTRADVRPESHYAHPAWLIEQIRADWPTHAEQVLAANNEPAPLWVRVNRRRRTVASYLELLAAQGISATGSDLCRDAVRLASPMAVEQLPGFDAGDVSVQDAAAQLAAPLLGATGGMRVLDACAAPGGKTCHILEATPDLGELLALDRSRERLAQVEENLGRLGLAAQVVAGDAAHPAEWWDGVPFDRILLDVSCSATGVIRRHPDIKLLRRASDLESLTREQTALLEALWPLLAAGGRLLYATCSVLRAENQRLIAAFLTSQSDASEVPPARELATAGINTAAEPGLQILPGAAGMDGFYYACLERRQVQ